MKWKGTFFLLVQDIRSCKPVLKCECCQNKVAPKFASFTHKDIIMVDSLNILPDYVVDLEAPSVKSFERWLDRLWADQPIRFDQESHMT